MVEKYQSFPDQKGASDSFAKLRLLHLPDMLGKHFLDVGCNEGFFCMVAAAAGAGKVVGIDASPEFIDRAQKRFPQLDFRCQSWDDALDEKFDVILMASAIHYATDQPALIRRLLTLLAPGAVLVLELGISTDGGAEYVEIKRPAGDTRKYATFGSLNKILEGYAYRVIGKSVPQSGDPVPRWVVHITARRPSILMFDTQSFTGKSSMVKLLCQGRGGPKDSFSLISLDGLFNDMEISMAARHPLHEDVISRIFEFKNKKSIYGNKIMEFICETDLIESFIDFVLDSKSRGAELLLWDGYIPENGRYRVRAYLRDKGYVVFSVDPFSDLNYPRLNVNEIFMSFPGNDFALRSQRGIRCEVDGLVISAGRIVIEGWAADLTKGREVETFSAFFNGRALGSKVAYRVMRPGATRETMLPHNIKLGFGVELDQADVTEIPELASLAKEAKGPMTGAKASIFGNRISGMKLFVIDEDGGAIEGHYNPRFSVVVK